MARVTVEDCLEKINDQFALVHLAALRYRQLHRGASRLVESRNKDIVQSLREIASGRVRFREDVNETIFAQKGKLVSQRLQKLIDEGTLEDPSLQDVTDEVENATPLI